MTVRARTAPRWYRSLLVSVTGFAAAILISGPGSTQTPSDQGGSPQATTRPQILGAADFPHDLHALDMEIDCTDCHHETNAKALVSPHPQSLETASAECRGCHRRSDKEQEPAPCSLCHPETPAHIADETLSSKVVIHEVCWRCHETGRGQAASRNCVRCHQSTSRNG